MSSKIRETRMKQKADAESAVEAREARLKAADCDDQKMARDPVLRKLKARLKKVELRLKAIDASDALNEALAQKKALAQKEAMPKEKPEAKGDAKPAKGKDKAKSKPKKSE